MAAHNKTGTYGEQLAVAYFRERGYAILHSNWRHKHWEVDIIASKGDMLHFIEIKTRRSLHYGLPEVSISKKKIQNLLNAAAVFLELHPGWKKIQVDVLAIILKDEPEEEYFLIEDVYNY